MKRYIKVTLETVEADDYPDLRGEMVNDLVQISLDDDVNSIREHYAQLVEEMYCNMDDDDLQSHHDVHVEFMKEFTPRRKVKNEN